MLGGDPVDLGPERPVALSRDVGDMLEEVSDGMLKYDYNA